MPFQKSIIRLGVLLRNRKSQKGYTRPSLSLGRGNSEIGITYVSAYGNEAKVERSSKDANVFEGGAMWIDVLFVIVVDTFR